MTVKAQDDVNCFRNVNCEGAQEGLVALEDCCNHGVAPFGVTFRIPGIEGCNECPVGKCPGL